MEVCDRMPVPTKLAFKGAQQRGKRFGIAAITTTANCAMHRPVDFTLSLASRWLRWYCQSPVLRFDKYRCINALSGIAIGRPA